ncbi:hypothetical protein LOTGIDRAFT_171333 [Lottia gigantea]|uniref:Uncharacterized protein n=1 Tax=Lottia gigantea TaxID=225164 RepID=V4CMG9_LOTGI|nr:hypothetical protein LOTGIDRAFT_171333 [Lottia gigantea]ESP03540.1 hypothetical protein LOTGIDRAFT_171333 [Lottia gigantea]
MEPSQNKNTFDYSEIGEETNDDPEISDEKEDKLNAYMKKHEEERLHDILPREMKIVIEKQEKEEDQRVKSVQAEHSLTSYSEIKPIVLKRNNGITESGDNSPESHSVSQTYTDNSGKAVDLPSNGMPSNPKTPKPMVPPFHPKGHIVVRETKASRLRKYRLQMENDLDDVQNVLPAVKARDKHPVKDSLAKSHRRTLSTSTAKGRPRPGFHPPLKFHTPGDYPNGDLIPPPDFAVRETKASKLRRLKKLEDEKREQETLKDMTFDIQVKPLQRQRSPPPTFKPAPPKPYKKPEPVFIKETRASKLRKQREIEEVNNKGTLKRDRTLYGTQQTNAKEIPSKSITVQDKERKNREVKRPKTAKAPRLLPTISQNPDEQLSENVSVNQLPKDSTQTGRRTVYRTSTTASDNNTLSTDKTSLKISTPISQKQRASVDITTSRLFEVDKMQQRKCRTPDWSARDRLCRLKVERGLEVGKKIRTAMEEDEKNWQAELISEFENVERPFLFGKADDETKRLVKEALCILRECLEASDTTETSKSKVKSFLSNKFKEYFTNKNRAGRDNIKNGHLRKKREEKINAYFGRTVQSLNRVLIDVWERFNDQQDTYRQMLEKITLLEEMLKKWKSEAKHHRFMHTMLKKDYLEGRKESWYL